MSEALLNLTPVAKRKTGQIVLQNKPLVHSELPMVVLQGCSKFAGAGDAADGGFWGVWTGVDARHAQYPDLVTMAQSPAARTFFRCR